MSRRRHRPGIADALPVDRGDRFEAVLGDFDEGGEASASHQDVPVSVSGGLPGERVVLEVVRKYHDRLACRVVEVLAPGPHGSSCSTGRSARSDPARVQPPCPYYGPCSGCQLQHVAYDRQLELKRERVLRALRRLPETASVEVRPTLPSDSPFRYRNHARFSIGREGEVGFVNRHTRRFLRVDECLLMAPAINDALARVQGRLKGMTQMSVRVGVNTGDRLVQPRLINPWTGVESGGQHYEESIRGRRFRVAGSSFFQVNVAMAEVVVDLVGEALRLTGRERVVDAYAGVGVFAALLAPGAREVIGIEDSATAVDDASANALGLDNVRFVQGRTESVLPTLAGTDAIVLDPPRAGCHPDALAALRALAPAAVAMVSCEPDALARDLAVLCQGGAYRVDWVQPVDMFPQTYHVECVAAIRRAA